MVRIRQATSNRQQRHISPHHNRRTDNHGAGLSPAHIPRAWRRSGSLRALHADGGWPHRSRLGCEIGPVQSWRPGDGVEELLVLLVLLQVVCWGGLHGEGFVLAGEGVEGAEDCAEARGSAVEFVEFVLLVVRVSSLVMRV